MPKFTWLDLNDCRGGRNGADDPLSLKQNEVVDMKNGDTYRCIFFRKRGGATAPSIGSAFTGIISSLLAHFPDNNPANAELWGCDDATPPIIGRMAAASTFSAPTLVDNPSTGAGPSVRGVSFQGKNYLAYQSAQDRLHAYDPNLSAPAVRRVGLSTPAEPTLSNFLPTTGAAVSAVVYRVRFRIKNGTVITAQSEPSSTDSTLTSVMGTDTGARTIVNMPTAPDSATHWVVELAIASTAPTVFYEQIEQPIATTTWTNTNSNATASTYVTIGAVSELLGQYAKWPSVKYLLAAFNRLLGLGQWGGTASGLISVLMAGGGGGGGSANGGGGAGAIIQQSNVLVSAQAYAIVVGTGGPKGTAGSAGTVGVDTTFNGLTAKGGGGGAGSAGNAGNGGSGGGGAGAAGRTAAGTTTNPLGNDGGAGVTPPSSGAGGGGSASKGTNGGNAPEANGGGGGTGISSSITGTATRYGGGGGGGAQTSIASDANGGGAGGSSIGGTGGSSGNGTPPTAGTANTGSGGGGGGYNTGIASYDGAAGGSGVVIIRYVTGTLTATGGTITTSGIYTIHTFNSSGTFTVTAISASTLKQSRVFYSAAMGDADHGDDERVPNALTQRNWIDLDEGTGGDGKGLAGPVSGSIYVFKYSQIRNLVPTGASSPVFNTITLSTTKGAIDQECICVGEDAAGRPCVYFMDPQVGPMIVGFMPPTEIGQGIRDIWDTVNLAATNKVGQVVEYPKLGQVWFWIATGSNNDPNVCMKYTKATGAWDVDDTGGKLRVARCAVLFARTLGASMSRDKVPYVGYQGSNNKLLRGDTTDLDDDGTTCQALLKTRPLAPNNGQPFRMSTPWILAKVQDGVTLTVTADGDFGRIVKTATVSLTPTADELAAGATRVIRRAEGLDISDITYLQLQIGDASAIAKSWTVERIYAPWEPQQSNP